MIRIFLPLLYAAILYFVFTTSGIELAVLLALSWMAADLTIISANQKH